MSDINTEKNPYVLSLDIKASGSTKMLEVDESEYSNAAKNEAMIGTAVRVQADGLEIEEITLTFRIKGNSPAQIQTMSVGTENYNIFMFCDDANMLLPVETKHGGENTISATVDRPGNYCVMDVEKWLEYNKRENTEERANGRSYMLAGEVGYLDNYLSRGTQMRTEVYSRGRMLTTGM